MFSHIVEFMIIKYITQSPDTSKEAELVQIRLWRDMSASQKLNLVKRVYQKGYKFALMGISHQFPHLCSAEVKQLFLQKRWQKLYNNSEQNIKYQNNFMLEDPIWLIEQLTLIFDSLNIPYYISGSVASSLQGEVRFTEDLDLVIEIQPEQVSPLINVLNQDFYISEVAVNEAVTGITTSFNVIHLQTTEKADIFVSRNDQFSISKMNRRQLYYTNENQKSFYVSSPEDTILQKLVWFQMSQEQSQKQWRDILGVIKLQGEKLDFDYLALWSKNLGVKDNLQQGISASGLSILL
jgi:hypothetical protein